MTEERTPSPARPRARTTWIDNVAGRLARIGADPRDDAELRQKKALLVLLAVLILPVSAVWGTAYLAFGSRVGIVPFIYLAVSLGSLVVFARTRRFHLLLVMQLVDILLTTTAGQMLVGGFLPSGGVGLWGILAPLGALVFLEVRRAIRWFGAFVLVFLFTGIAGEVLFRDADLPIGFTSTMLALNVIGAGAVAFTLLATFANQRNVALAALRVEKEKSELLLTNILPGSIAERLKAASKTIADHSTRRPSSSPTSSTSRRSRSGSRRLTSSASSISSSPTSTPSSSGMGSRRSRRSAMPTWPPRACRIRARITRAGPRSWRSTCAQRLPPPPSGAGQVSS